ncbi:MAG: class I SAM-dependent methyltransferase [Clostridiales bacterium]|nr:class I SAM-dependent methyltransferase [Clostridiales bacterium]
MKPDYQNWVPKGMVAGILGATALTCAGTIVCAATGALPNGILRAFMSAVFGIAFVVCAGFSVWCVRAYRAFSYGGQRQLSRKIVEGLAQYVSVPDGGKILDVGCGSGALTIACAKRNPGCAVTGLDRWGKEYASYSRRLCESNARAEGVTNTVFVKGNAVRLDFPDGSFDAVTSNYVYHNVPARDRQKLLLETLRVLRPGGVFAIHDLMTPRKFGDMSAFAQELKKRGYRKVALIDTTNGRFMRPKEAKRLMLRGSAILFGFK